MASTWLIGTAFSRGDPACSGTRDEPAVTGGRPAGGTWTRLPQDWHFPQRPAHLGARQPHSEHSYDAAVASFPMTGTVAAGTDTHRPDTHRPGIRRRADTRAGSWSGSRGVAHKLAGSGPERHESGSETGWEVSVRWHGLAHHLAGHAQANDWP